MLEESLIALLDLRASQINGCLLCVRHHLCRACRAGVAPAKLAAIGAWRDAGLFSPREKAALAWAEHLAGAVGQSVPHAVGATLKAHFNDSQVAALSAYWQGSELWSGDEVLCCCAVKQDGRTLVVFRRG